MSKTWNRLPEHNKEIWFGGGKFYLVLLEGLHRWAESAKKVFEVKETLHRRKISTRKTFLQLTFSIWYIRFLTSTKSKTLEIKNNIYQSKN